MSGNLWSYDQIIDVVSANIKSNYVSGVPPSVTYAGMLWSNNVSNILYQRDSTNTIWIPIIGSVESSVSNFEVTALLTLDVLTNIKDCGYVIDPTSHLGVNADAAGWVAGNYGQLFCTTVSPLDHSTLLSDPILVWTQGLYVEKDLQSFGFLGTSSDPYKHFGGGAI